jgi:hypothetical protein
VSGKELEFLSLLRILLLVRAKKRTMGMPNALWESLIITATTPFVYIFTINFPLTTSVVIASILVKN